ncbi:uncharacterized protein LOC112883507 [Panicum hallii]|nr:uncharacterized protein LOC112883507 [Panicum hallii]
MTLCRALVQALCYPLAMWAAARFDRARVVAAGTFLCAAATALVGASSTVLQMAVARGFNGVGMALVLPAVYSLVADYSDDDTRGSTFGWVFMVLGVGSAMGNSMGVLLAPNAFFGVPGWRLAFHALALVSVAIAVATWLLAADSRPGTRNTKAAPAVAELAREAKAVVSVPTFWIIVAQGAAAQVPWLALTFMAMWLELEGFTHWETTVITSLNCFSNGLGALLAGFAGDLAARRFPDAGRVALAQASNASIVPLAALLLLPARPGWPLAGAVYAGGFFLLGVAMAWSTVSTSSPILAEIVPEKARTAAYALDLCLENVVASFGAPVVGILAERVFGYRPRAASGGASAQAADRRNAAALGKAIFAEIAVPATICCVAYSALYWTYPADRKRARMAADALALQEAPGDKKNYGCEASEAAADGFKQPLLSVTVTE